MRKHVTRHVLLLLLPALLAASCASAADELTAANTTAAIATAGATTPTTASNTTPPQVEVTLRRVDGHPTFDVSASIVVSAGLAHCWGILTDYDRLAQFVPNMSESHVLSRENNVSVVAQQWLAKFLFIRQPVALQLLVTEQPMRSIDIRRISGDMHTYEARWELQKLPDGSTRIGYGGVIAPDFYVPSLFGSAMMKSDLRAMLEAVRAEIDKR